VVSDCRSQFHFVLFELITPLFGGLQTSDTGPFNLHINFSPQF